MPDTPKFPVPLHHPDTGGETTAATPSSLRVLEARGWKRGPKPPEKTGTVSSSGPPTGETTVRTSPPDSDKS